MINGITWPDSIPKDLTLLEKCKSILRSKDLPDITLAEIDKLTLEDLKLSPDDRFIHAKFEKPDGIPNISYTVLNIRKQVDLTLVWWVEDLNESK